MLTSSTFPDAFNATDTATGDGYRGCDFIMSRKNPVSTKRLLNPLCACCSLHLPQRVLPRITRLLSDATRYNASPPVSVLLKANTVSLTTASIVLFLSVGLFILDRLLRYLHLSNFSLDVSLTPLSVFDDSSIGIQCCVVKYRFGILALVFIPT